MHGWRGNDVSCVYIYAACRVGGCSFKYPTKIGVLSPPPHTRTYGYIQPRPAAHTTTPTPPLSMAASVACKGSQVKCELPAKYKAAAVNQSNKT